MTALKDANQLLNKMAQGLTEQIQARGIDDPLMVGIHTGGAWLAETLHQHLGINEPLGKLDISFYRDDFSRIGVHPEVKPSSLPLSVDDRHIILIDDVLHTGRTIRAALNEIFDYGRPASVTLAVMIDRGGRELPIEATVVGQTLQLTAHEHVKLSGPDPLSLCIVEAPQVETTPPNSEIDNQDTRA